MTTLTAPDTRSDIRADIPRPEIGEADWSWSNAIALACAACAMGTVVAACIPAAHNRDVLVGMSVALTLGGMLAFAWPWVGPVVDKVVIAHRAEVIRRRALRRQRWAESRHRTRMVRILAASRPETRIALVSRHLDEAVGAVLLHRLTVHHLRPSTTHIGLYAVAPWRRLVAVYEVASIEATDDGFLVHLGRGGHLVEPLPLAIACGLSHAPTPIRYLDPQRQRILSGALAAARPLGKWS